MHVVFRSWFGSQYRPHFVPDKIAVIPRDSAIITIPITDDSFARELHECRVFRNKCRVRLFFEAIDMFREKLLHLDHVFAQQLDDEWRDEKFGRMNERTQVFFSYESIMMPAVDAIQDHLVARMHGRHGHRSRFVMINARGNRQRFAANGHGAYRDCVHGAFGGHSLEDEGNVIMN